MASRDRFISGGPDGDAPTSLTRDVDRLVHKLRTPLNSLSLNADLLASVSTAKAGKEALYQRALKSLQTEVTRLDTIAGDFQHYVSASNPKLAEVAIAEVVGTAVGELGAKDNGARKVEVVAPAPSVKITADPRLLSMAILELLRNAVEAGEGGAVKLEARLSGDQLVVDVADSGPGFDFDPPDRAYELFMGSKQGHLGFGLTFARRVARVHGGDLEITRSAKDGATVRLTVPLRAALEPSHP